MIDFGSVQLASSTSSAGLNISGLASQDEGVIRTHMDRTIKSAQGAHRREESNHSGEAFRRPTPCIRERHKSLVGSYFW